MKPMTLSEVARMAGGTLHGSDATVEGLATDTRRLRADGRPLFVALRGENFDAHDHLDREIADRVAGVLVSRPVNAGVPEVRVADTQLALAQLAAAVQAGRSTRVVAITGSNGKTSVKTLLLSVLAEAFARVHGNPGNYNNEIGLPLAVLDAPEDAEVAVYEMGAGKPGDIAYLARIAVPHAALVNNIAPAHVERMGNLLAIADTKAAVYDALPRDGVAVINADDAFAPFFAERAHGRRLVRFGLEATADVTARDIQLTGDGSRFVLVTPAGEAPVELVLRGRHNVRNALAAAALATGLGVDLEAIACGLAAARPVEGRLVTHRLRGGVTLVDDSYNANPGSLAAAIDTVAEGAGEGWLVLGDMRELGEDAEAMHAEAGRRAKAAGITRLFALGSLSAAAAEAFGEDGQVLGSHGEVADAIRAALDSRVRGNDGGEQEEIRVLVKGSRGSAMDTVVRALLADVPGGGETGGDDHAA